MSVPARPQVWIACLLSLFCSGLGHVYCGRTTRGVVLFLLSLVLVPASALFAGLVPSTVSLLVLGVSFLALVGLWGFAVVDAGRIASRSTEQLPGELQRPAVFALFLAAGVSSPLLSTFYVRQNLLEAFYLPTESMRPLLQHGDRIIANKTAWRLRQLEHRDVIVFRPPDERAHVYIKRIIGLPGDRVTIAGDIVEVNGAPEAGAGTPDNVETAPTAPSEEQPATEPERQGRLDVTVPHGMCFVLGDNRTRSRDSRAFGMVPLGDVLGVAEYVYLPAGSWSRFGTLR